MWTGFEPVISVLQIDALTNLATTPFSHILSLMHIMSSNIKHLNYEMDLLETLGYNQVNYDARWKWASLLNMFFQIQKELPKGYKPEILEAGGGHSPIGFLLSKISNYTNVDADFNDRWFPSNIGVALPLLNQRVVEQDFLSYCATIQDSSIDIVLDGCSIIHFNTTPKRINKGLYDTCLEIKRILKPGGSFIIVSDSLYPEEEVNLKDNKGEFLYPQRLFECIESTGLKCTTELQTKFKKKIITVQETKDVQYKKLLPEKPIDAWYQGSKLLTISAGIFKKE